MGEIGIPRREFLYEIEFWETERIIRGYRRRDYLRNQLMAECTYAAIYAMRDPKGKNVKDLFPELFEEEDETQEPDITEEEVKEMQDMMDEWNWGNNKK